MRADGDSRCERPDAAYAIAAVTTFECRNPRRTGCECSAKVTVCTKQLALHGFLEVSAYDQGVG